MGSIKILIITIMSITVTIIIIIYKILWKWCKVGNREMLYDTCKKNLKNQNDKISGIYELPWTTIPRMDKWEIPNLGTICYIKPSTLKVKYLVKSCIRSNRNILSFRLNWMDPRNSWLDSI